MSKKPTKSAKPNQLQELYDEVAALELGTSNSDRREAFREVMTKIKEHQAK